MHAETAQAAEQRRRTERVLDEHAPPKNCCRVDVGAERSAQLGLRAPPMISTRSIKKDASMLLACSCC